MEIPNLYLEIKEVMNTLYIITLYSPLSLLSTT